MLVAVNGITETMVAIYHQPARRRRVHSDFDSSVSFRFTPDRRKRSDDADARTEQGVEGYLESFLTAELCA
jgi:hypothetical protein